MNKKIDSLRSKILLTIILLLSLLLADVSSASAFTGEFFIGKYKKIERTFTALHQYYDMKIYNTSELTEEILTNNTPIIERCIGVVLNQEGDGRILNSSSNYNYISYKDIAFVTPGTVLVTFSVYSGKDVDDVVERANFIIGEFVDNAGWYWPEYEEYQQSINELINGH